MCRRGRMDRQTACIADIGYMIEQLQRIDETLASFNAADQLETKQGTISTLKISVGAPSFFASGTARMDNPNNLRVSTEEIGNSLSIGCLCLDAKRQGF